LTMIVTGIMPHTSSCKPYFKGLITETTHYIFAKTRV
jgi:hypothetical protein